MADSLKIGKFLLLFYVLLFLFASCGIVSRVFVISDDQDQDHESEKHHEDALVLDRQQVQLERLEDLVRNLGEMVTRLESRLSESSNPKLDVGVSSVQKQIHHEESRSVPPVLPPEAVQGGDHNDELGFSVGVEAGSVGSVARGREEGRGRLVSVTKYSPFWTERFHFVSAVRLDSDATCIDVLPFRDFEGHRKYVAVGDGRGRVYVFHRNGDVALEFQTLTEFPIAAMLSYMSVYKNESVVVTGHGNGMILIHRMWEQSNGEEWSSLQMEYVRQCASFEIREDGSSISILEVHHVGRIRYILSTDVMGKIRVFRENGTFYGSAVSTRRPLAFLKQRLLFLTEDGAGSLDLRTMKIKESQCEGMNHSIARNYVFDAAERSKAYGFTSEGDLIHVLLLGDIMNFKCRVRSKRKLEMVEPLVLHAIKGYLLIVSQEKVSVYNVSSQHYVRTGAPRLLFFADLDEIRSSFLNHQVMNADTQRRRVVPLIASDQEKLLVLSLGDGYIGTYHSNLPIFKSESGTFLWSSPVLFFILFLLGAWLFFAKKKEALTSWGPDDPFNSTPALNGVPMGSGSGDRSFADSSSRNADVMDLRSGGLRGPSRRYASPSQYPSGAVNFMPGSDDHKPRLAPVDPNFRAPSELKFRGSNLDSTGFQKRRESLFANSQVVDDGN